MPLACASFADIRFHRNILLEVGLTEELKIEKGGKSKEDGKAKEIALGQHKSSYSIIIKINHANKTVSNDFEIREVSRVRKTDNAGSRAEKMSGSSVGDSNHEYMRRNGVIKRIIRNGKRRKELRCIPVHLRRSR